MYLEHVVGCIANY